MAKVVSPMTGVSPTPLPSLYGCYFVMRERIATSKIIPAPPPQRRKHVLLSSPAANQRTLYEKVPLGFFLLVDISQRYCSHNRNNIEKGLSM